MSGPRTTRRNLLRACVVLVALTVLTAVLAFAAVDQAQRTADSVRDDTVPALVEVSAARGALIEADEAAVVSFRTGAVRLSGPGDDYRDQIAIASQNLTQAATHDLGDDATRRTLSLVNSLLTSYASAIEQAAASFRDNEHTALWASDLWTASRLLHATDGALALLDDLRDAQVSKLDAQVDAGTGSVLGVLWQVLAYLLLVLLLGTLVWLLFRFHRIVNLGLVAATLLVAGLVVVFAWVFDTGGGQHATRDLAHELTDTWERRMTARDTQGQQALGALIEEQQCPTRLSECGSTVQRVVAEARSAGSVDVSADQLTDGSARIEAQAGASTGHGLYLTFIPGAAALAVLATGFGLYQRFDEYRFRSR